MEKEERQNRPLISIITVVYNGEKYLKQTILSVINQTYSNVEYIIIDGGSTDGTLSIIKKYEPYISQWHSGPDRGLYDAMNIGIRKAKGELVGMINSDDWFEPEALQWIADAYKQNPNKKIFHGDRMDVLTDGSRKLRKFNTSKFKFVYYGMTYNHPSMFVHKDIYEVQLYNTELRALSDYEFVLKNLLSNPKNFLYIPKSYVNYRLDGISGTMSFYDAIKEGYLSRKNAGLNLVQNMISITFRILRVSINRLIAI